MQYFLSALNHNVPVSPCDRTRESHPMHSITYVIRLPSVFLTSLHTKVQNKNTKSDDSLQISIQRQR